MQTWMIAFLTLFVGFLFGLVVFPYLRAYSAKRGENLATHDNIDKLVKQVEAVTEATKAIETRISNEVWDRQRRWELKRDVLLDGIKRIATLDDALSSYKSFMGLDTVRTSQGPELDLHWSQRKLEVKQEWGKATTNFDETRYYVGTICSRELKQVLDDLGIFAHLFGAELTRGNIPAEPQGQTEFFTRKINARAAIRKELGIEPLITSQSSESSAAPNLARLISEAK
jgi:hypothetical protein